MSINAIETLRFNCTTCPSECLLTVEVERDADGAVVEVRSVTGNSCPRGDTFAHQELTCPMRVLTTTVAVSGGDEALLPVRTAEAIPLALHTQAMDLIRGLVVDAPHPHGRRRAEGPPRHGHRPYRQHGHRPCLGSSFGTGLHPPLKLRWNSSCFRPLPRQTGTISPQLMWGRMGYHGGTLAKGFFMAHVDDQRVARVLDALEAQHPGAQLLVNDPWSIYYLTGFYADMFERFCGVLLARNAEPVILVNALHQLPEYDNARVAYHTDTDVVADAIAREVDPSKPLGIDTVMRSGFLMPLMDRHAASEFFLGDFAVTAARTHKDAAEQELMRASSAANEAVMADAIKLVHEGVTEREIADQMLGLYRNHGCGGFSFPPIVSFGANAGDPHHEPDDTVLKRGDVVLFDIGGRHRNYCSDMTRTFFWGEPDEETARIYDIVRRANEAAEALIAPDVRMCDLDRAARDVIEDAGYGQYFTHRLGHSIGLQDHEPGDVSLVNEQVVEPGMTFSIEPGIYLPGRTGVRIEDLALVTESGVEILNAYPHDPVRLD